MQVGVGAGGEQDPPITAGAISTHTGDVVNKDMGYLGRKIFYLTIDPFTL